MKRELITSIAIIVFLILIVSCASSSTKSDQTYDFWDGLWDGLIAPINFICMLFSNDFIMYADKNNNSWYAFGFLLGCSSLGEILNIRFITYNKI